MSNRVPCVVFNGHLVFAIKDITAEEFEIMSNEYGAPKGKVLDVEKCLK